MKRNPNPLVELARIEQQEPGRLASWLRAHPPEKPAPEMNNAFFVSAVNLNHKGKAPCSKS